MDELIERLENARSDADYWASKGSADHTMVSISREDCTEIGKLLTKAYGAALLGKRDADLAETLAVLSGAFSGDEGDEDED